MSQADQDRLAKNPRWSPVYASASSASNSSYYFSHVTREAARIVFLHGLWPAALAIWARSGQTPSRAPKSENARWSNGSLTVEGMVEDLEPLPLARLAQEAHARGFVVGAVVHGFNRWLGRKLISRWMALRCARRWTRCRCATATAMARARKNARWRPHPTIIRCWIAAPCLFHRSGTTTRWLATTPQSARWPSLRSTRPAERSRC